MIYCTGDCHGDFGRFKSEIFPEQKQMDKNDTVIILGDFGGVWDYNKESKREKYWLDWLEDKPFTTVFVDGNHECFRRLYQYPIKKWNGGKVHEIRPHVLHLMRGEVYTIEGLRFFAFGGASSHDIQDGILDPEKDADKIKRWSNDYSKMFRVKERSWWKEELPTTEEMNNGRVNLQKVNNEVDFIVSHCAPQSIASLYSHGLYKPDILTLYFDEIKENTKFKKWLFGHYHTNENILSDYLVLWEQLVRIK